MRDRDAVAIVREAQALLDTIAEQMLRARTRLRTWKSDGFAPGRGADGSAGTSGEDHADPVLRAVQDNEIVDRDTEEQKHKGWREDEFDKALKILDGRIFAVRDAARALDRDITSLLAEPEALGEEGCVLCNAVRLGAGHDCDCNVDAHKDCRTKCNPDDCECPCGRRDHRHPNSHQRIHNRRAPRPPFDYGDPVEDLARCKWHYDFAVRYGVDAHASLALWHLEHPGSHIPLIMIRERHPAQYNALQEYRRQGATA